MTATQCSLTRGHPDKLNKWTRAKVQRQIFAAAYCSFKTLIYAVGTVPKAAPYLKVGWGFLPERDRPVALEQVMQCDDCTAPMRERKRMEGGWKKMRESVGGTDVDGYVPH